MNAGGSSTEGGDGGSSSLSHGKEVDSEEVPSSPKSKSEANLKSSDSVPVQPANAAAAMDNVDDSSSYDTDEFIAAAAAGKKRKAEDISGELHCELILCIK
jgi:3-oxoacyl-ACP reductase-like protein